MKYDRGFTIFAVVVMMDESNPYNPPRSWITAHQIWATTIGGVASACALLGLVAFVGYGTFATRAMHAAARDPVAAHHMASYAGGFSLAQLLLGQLAVGLGWAATARGRGPRLSRGLGAMALGLGIMVLLLLLVLV